MATTGRYFQDPSGSFFLFGPRGTGKSTWLRRRFPGAVYLDLLDPSLHRILSARPERLEEMAAGQPEGGVVIVGAITCIPIEQFLRSLNPSGDFNPAAC